VSSSALVVGRRRPELILITVKFPIREDRTEQWHELSAFDASAVSAEPGCVFFEFSRSVAEPGTFVCIEGFRDAAAGQEHMGHDHVARFMAEMPDIVAAQPQIIDVDAAEAEGFVPMGEIQPRGT
jgi:quinol monooxygenase YgiN